MKHTKFVVAAYLMLTTIAAFSQPSDGRISVRAIYYENIVWVRWAPGDFETWQWANQHEGYQLTRFLLRDGAHYLSPDEIAASETEVTAKALVEPEGFWEVMPADSNLTGIVAGTIYGDSLETIDWSNPDFIQIANTSETRQQRFGFCLFACDQDFEIAQAAGLGRRDNEAAGGDREYLYVVRLNGTEIRGIATLTTTTQSLPQPPKPGAMSGDKRALISWDKTKLLDTYTAYTLERSADNGLHWAKINSTPVMPLTGSEKNEAEIYWDSLPNNTTTYVYRVTGRSSFGIDGPPSDTVHAKGMPAPLIGAPQITACDEQSAGTIRIAWAFPAEDENLVDYFEVFRSDRINGTYQQIGLYPPGSRQGNDTNPLAANYYMVKAKDINGIYVLSLPHLGQTKDITPPSAPVALKGRCDKSGAVTVGWARNPETDIWGYRVYLSDQPVADSAFVQVTSRPVTDTFFRFRISLQTLTPAIYVFVRALDRHENPSLPSLRVRIARPDIVPPAAPLITAVTPLLQGIAFELTPSPSDDVVRYVFQKRREGMPGWQTWATYTRADLPKGCIDSIPYATDAVSRRSWYQYRLVAYDEADNAGGSEVLRTKPLDMGIREPIKNLTAVYGGPNTFVGTVRLNWSHQSDPDLVGFQVYRAIDTSQMRPYRFISPADAIAASQGPKPWGFGDRDIDVKSLFTRTVYAKPGLQAGTYTQVPAGAVNKPVNTTPSSAVILRYQVMAVYTDGAQSPLSSEVQITIQ